MSISRRIVLGLGSAALAVALAGVGFAAGQGDPAQGPGAGQGRQGRFGGPGGPGGPGFGRGGRGGPGGPMGILGPGMMDRLDLTADQRDRVKQILDSHKEDQQAIDKRARAAHDALEAAITADNFDETLIRTRSAEVAAVEADETVLRGRIYAQVLQILTSDQQAKLKTMRTEMQQRRQRMDTNRGQRGQRH